MEPQSPDTPAGREAAYEAEVRAHFRRNYLGLFIQGMLGLTGFRVLGAPTLIPAYLHLLSGSNLVVGLVLSLQQVGQTVSPLIGANAVEHRRKLLPTAMALGFGLRLPILMMALAAWFLEGRPLIVAMGACLLFFGLFQGAQRVAFQSLMAKVIPLGQRGRLSALRNVTGGLIAALLSYLAGRYLIEHQVFGDGYATTFLAAFILTSLGLVFLQVLMVEPPPPTVRERTPLIHRMRDVRALVRDDRDYRNFLIAQALSIGGRLAAPFYILHVAEKVGLSGATIGLLSLAFLGADTLSNVVWGYMGDRIGFRSNFVGALVIWIVSLALLLFADSVPLFLLAFAGLGAAWSGYLMATNTMVLEFGHRDDVPMRLGVSATVEGVMLAFGPLAGGLIASAFGYPPVFMLAMVLQLAAFAVLIVGVREPRTRRP